MHRIAPTRISSGARPLVCPPDKSLTHRAFLFSLLSTRESRIRGPLLGQDCLSSLEAVRKLGGRVESADGVVRITGFGVRGFAGSAGTSREKPLVLDCGNSGTTMRLLAGLLAGNRGYFRLIGDGSLSRRPMGRVSEPLLRMGAVVLPRGKNPKGAPCPPVEIEPSVTGLSATTHRLAVASAQVKSALLLAGLWCVEGETRVIEPALSRDHTERMLRSMGVEVLYPGVRPETGDRSPESEDSESQSAVRGCRGRDLAPLELAIAGDPSSAAFWVCAALLQGRSVRIEGVLLNPTRIGFLEVLRRMGARVRVESATERGGEPVGAIETAGGELRAAEVQAREIPSLIDEVPMLAIVAAWASGTTVFRGVQELRVKESDRLAAVIAFIESLGGHAWAKGNDLFVEGRSGGPPGPARGEWRFSTLGDHRLAMAVVVTADALQREIVLDDAECIKVSYPGFFQDREALSR